MIKILIAIVTLASMLGGLASGTHQEPRIFEYSRLQLEKDELVKVLHATGYVVVRGIPGFVQAYEEYLLAAADFAALSPEQKEKCTPAVGANSLGWSRGIEKFNGVVDVYKGSYYARIPDQNGNNLWPETTDYREKYLALGNLIRTVGLKVLSFLDLPGSEYSNIVRGLDYSAIPLDTKDPNPNWCGEHKDTGVFTGICPAAYYDAVTGERLAEEPEEAGLFVSGRKANIPRDCLGFQVGEAAQIISSDRIRATPHLVRRALGLHRRTLAIFFDLGENFVMESNTQSFPGRYRPNMTYGQWVKETLALYRV